MLKYAQPTALDVYCHQQLWPTLTPHGVYVVLRYNLLHEKVKANARIHAAQPPQVCAKRQYETPSALSTASTRSASSIYEAGACFRPISADPRETPAEARDVETPESMSDTPAADAQQAALGLVQMGCSTLPYKKRRIA